MAALDRLERREGNNGISGASAPGGLIALHPHRGETAGPHWCETGGFARSVCLRSHMESQTETLSSAFCCHGAHHLQRLSQSCCRTGL